MKLRKDQRWVEEKPEPVVKDRVEKNVFKPLLDCIWLVKASWLLPALRLV